MKKALQYISILFFILISGFSSAQEHEILDRFSLQEADGKVFISCTISSGSTCNGIDVLRSDDNVNYKMIAFYSGVCGSLSSPVTYNFVDEYPVKNKKSYYKLELGGQGFTDPLSITVIDLEGEEFQVRPNPAKGKTQIYFRNPKNLEQELIVYNSSGAQVLSKSSNTNVFELDVRNLPSGIYPFSISGEIKGKLAVDHQ